MARPMNREPWKALLRLARWSTAINCPDVRILHGSNGADRTVFVHLDGVHTARSGLHGKKRRVSITAGKFLNHLRQIKVCETIAIVGQKHLFLVQVRLYRRSRSAIVERIPVSTKVIVQSSMSLCMNSSFRPPCESTKSFETDSSYSRK